MKNFRIICNKVDFFVSETQIKNGVGSHTEFNKAVLEAWCYINDHSNTKGVVGTFNKFSLQLDVAM